EHHVAVRTCPKVQLSLENGRVLAMGMEKVAVEGTWLEFSCDPGFHLLGSSTSNCTKMGRWS
ncbi:GABR1 protein, partial [Turnix velox]|nr:GABR1 protein [Turnix velox]